MAYHLDPEADAILRKHLCPDGVFRLTKEAADRIAKISAEETDDEEDSSHFVEADIAAKTEDYTPEEIAEMAIRLNPAARPLPSLQPPADKT